MPCPRPKIKHLLIIAKTDENQKSSDYRCPLFPMKIRDILQYFVHGFSLIVLTSNTLSRNNMCPARLISVLGTFFELTSDILSFH